MSLRFHKTYFLLAMLLFAIEVIIALFVNDAFVRPYLGDVLVVILVYCSVMAFFKLPYIPTAIGVLLFAFVVETLQYFKFINMLGLQHNKAAQIIFGNSFSWLDMVAYVAGIAIVILVEYLLRTKRQTKIFPT